MRQQKKLAVILLTAALALALFGCGKKDDPKAMRLDAAEEFLEEFFDFDDEERSEWVEAFRSDADVTASGETLEDALSKYYQDAYGEIATEECIDAMSADRYPFKFDLQLADEGVTDASIARANCHVTDSSDDTVSFEVTFLPDEANTALNAPLKGELVIEIESGKTVVTSIRFF